MRVNIYIASSIKGIKRQNGVVGYVIEADIEKKPTVTQFGSVKDVTVTQSNLLALKYALQRIKAGNDIEIYTEDVHIQAAFANGWMEKWLENGWKTAKGKDVANKEEWTSILEVLGGCVPKVHVGQQHEYRNYLNAETERRGKKYV